MTSIGRCAGLAVAAWLCLPAAAGTTLRVAVELDRDGARLVAWTREASPVFRGEEAMEPGRSTPFTATLELVPKTKSGGGRAERKRIGPICLDHPPLAPPHVVGDTIAVHRDTVVLTVADAEGADRIEIARIERRGEGLERRVLATEPLDAGRFRGGARPEGSAGPAQLTPGGVTWPEDVGDADRLLVAGDAGESDRRTNVVVVPDGYLYSDKALLRQHFEQLVAFFRSKTPFREHDPFVNYVLVYAYSAESGTDQCDCGIVRDTAMSSGFPPANPSCGHSDNRCLYYGSACDADSSIHLAEAELRVPGYGYGQGDRTVVMVHTARYGGCGGLRAVYSAGNPAATEIAAHELGHALAGLADEYEAIPSCGFGAGEINTSLDPSVGAWPEWIDALGAPRQGAEYYSQCVYRPQASCDMRSLGVPFCAVCNQRWSLVFFASPRVAPTAPIAAALPASPVAASSGAPVTFQVSTRLGPFTTNEIVWQAQGPGDPTPVTIATGTNSITRAFGVAGEHAVTCRVTAHTNFIRPSRNGANVDVASWSVTVAPVPPREVSPPGSSAPLVFTSPTDLAWEGDAESGASSFHLYRGEASDLAAGSFRTCLSPSLPTPAATDAAVPPTGGCFVYLVTGVNPAGEGSMGAGSSGVPRANDHPCLPGAP